MNPIITKREGNRVAVSLGEDEHLLTLKWRDEKYDEENHQAAAIAGLEMLQDYGQGKTWHGAYLSYGMIWVAEDEDLTFTT